MKVLIVDDSKFSQISAANFLKKINKEIEVSFANDGQEGFEQYKEVKPDLVLIDLLMPVVSGKELVRMIRDYDQDSKLVVVSADVQRSVQEEMLSYGALAFINKPLTEEKAVSIFKLIEGV